MHVIWKTTASVFQLFLQIRSQILKYNIWFLDFMPYIDKIPFFLHKNVLFSLSAFGCLSVSLAHGSWLCAVRLICPVWLCMLNAVLNCPAPSAHTPSYTHNSHPSRPRANPPQTSSHTPKTNPALSNVLLSPAAHLKEGECFIPHSCFDSLFEKISLVMFKNRR